MALGDHQIGEVCGIAITAGKPFLGFLIMACWAEVNGLWCDWDCLDGLVEVCVKLQCNDIRGCRLV
jgi:hypothetical protein